MYGIEPDLVQKAFSSDEYTVIEKPEGEYLTEWSVQRTQSKQLQEYYRGKNITTEIIVAVIDTGIDYNHEIFENRIIRSYFNGTSDGTSNDEMDSNIMPHGTMVASTVIDNSPEFVKVQGYKVGDDEGNLIVSASCAAILQAIQNDVDVMNLSFSFDRDSELLKETIEEACEKDIHIICAAGNSCMVDPSALPPSIEKTISVSATDCENITS